MTRLPATQTYSSYQQGRLASPRKLGRTAGTATASVQSSAQLGKSQGIEQRIHCRTEGSVNRNGYDQLCTATGHLGLLQGSLPEANHALLKTAQLLPVSDDGRYMPAGSASTQQRRGGPPGRSATGCAEQHGGQTFPEGRQTRLPKRAAAAARKGSDCSEGVCAKTILSDLFPTASGRT